MLEHLDKLLELARQPAGTLSIVLGFVVLFLFVWAVQNDRVTIPPTIWRLTPIAILALIFGPFIPPLFEVAAGTSATPTPLPPTATSIPFTPTLPPSTPTHMPTPTPLPPPTPTATAQPPAPSVRYYCRPTLATGQVQVRARPRRDAQELRELMSLDDEMTIVGWTDPAASDDVPWLRVSEVGKRAGPMQPLDGWVRSREPSTPPGSWTDMDCNFPTEGPFPMPKLPRDG